MSERLAPAKLNLALVVGPRRKDGKHEVTTVLQRITLADTVTLEPAAVLTVEGFPEDTLVRGALELVADRVGTSSNWRATIEKQIPIAAGLGAPPRGVLPRRTVSPLRAFPNYLVEHRIPAEPACPAIAWGTQASV